MAMAAVAKQIIVSQVKSQNGLQHRRQEQQMKMSHCSLKGELRNQEGDGDRETENQRERKKTTTLKLAALQIVDPKQTHCE